MRLGKAILAIAGAIYLATGAAFLLVPRYLANGADISLDGASAHSMIRSVQGGFQAGYGAFLLFCLRKSDFVRFALVSMIFTGGGFVIGRITSIAADGSPNWGIYALLAQEIVGVMAAVLVLNFIRKGN